MPTIDLVLPRPHPGQQEVLDCRARFRVLACGRRWGKTVLGKLTVVKAALGGGLYWWVLPDYGMATEAWRDLVRTCAPVTAEVLKSERRIELITGGVIQVKSAHNPDSLRGAGLDGAVLDEAAFMSEEAWLGGIRPALSDKRGWALFLSTPSGMNWFHRIWQAGNDPLEPEWKSFHRATASSPTVRPEEIEAARRRMPERWFRQEYEAAFIEDAGAVFRNITQVCVAAPQTEPHPDHTYVMGVDWGRVDDFTVITVLDTTTRQMVALDRFNQIGWETQRGRLVALAERWRPAVILAESNSIGEPNIEALQAAGLPVRPFQTTAQSKMVLIDALALAMEQETVMLLNDPVLVGEMQAYQVERLPSGTYRYAAPEGMHDDTVMATALGWEACTHSRITLLSFA